MVIASISSLKEFGRFLPIVSNQGPNKLYVWIQREKKKKSWYLKAPVVVLLWMLLLHDL